MDRSCYLSCPSRIVHGYSSHAEQIGLLLRSAGWIAATLLLVGLYATNPNFGGRRADARTPLAGDFLQEWVGGYLVRTGHGDQLYDVRCFDRLQHDRHLVGFSWDDQAYLPPVYPPFYYVLVSPLAVLPFAIASAVWATLQVAAVVLSCWLVGDLVVTGSQPGQTGRDVAYHRFAYHRFATTGWLFFAAVLYPSVIESLSSSQKGSLLLLLFVGAYRCHSKGYSATAGMIFGLVCIKPQLAWLMPLVMMIRGQWRFIAGMATTVVLLLAISLSLGLTPWRDYFSFLRDASRYSQSPGYEHYLHRAPSLTGFWAQLLGADSRWFLPALVISGLLAIGMLLPMVVRDSRCGNPHVDGWFSATVIATCLVSPHLFSYDLTLLLLPVVLAVKNEQTHRRKVAIAAAIYLVGCLSRDIAAATLVQPATILLAVWLAALAFGGPSGGDPLQPIDPPATVPRPLQEPDQPAGARPACTHGS